MLPKSFLGLSNLSECHLAFLLKFYGVLYTPTPILGYTLKSAIAIPKVHPLNSYSRENKLYLFFRLVPKWLCRTQGVMSVTEIVNRMFSIFAFSLQLLKAFRIKFQKFAAHAQMGALINETFIPT